MADFLLYGATGYTGRLIARRAVARGMRPIVAGRDPARVHRLAAELGVQGRAFGLAQSDELDRALGDVSVVLHCAGPFARTWRQMVDACLRTGRHYLDLTGEIEVHESIAGLDEAARTASAMLLPGAGFDLVPTDCLAAHVKERLPGATRLSIGVGHASWRDRRERLRLPTLTRGTLRSALDGMLERGLVRRGGELVEVPTAAWGRRIRLAGPASPSQPAVLFPLAELAALYRSTGVGEIEGYVALPRLAIFLLRLLRRAAGRLSGVERMMPEGPSDEELTVGQSLAWAEARDGVGGSVEAWLSAPNAYAFTAESALAAVQRVLDGDARPGHQTPSTAFGAGFVRGLPGVILRE